MKRRDFLRLGASIPLVVAMPAVVVKVESKDHPLKKKLSNHDISKGDAKMIVDDMLKSARNIIEKSPPLLAAR